MSAVIFGENSSEMSHSQDNFNSLLEIFFLDVITLKTDF